MSLRGIRGTLSNFIAAGGHFGVATAKAFGSTRIAIDTYISRHIIAPSVGDIRLLDTLANEGIQAAIANNSLSDDQIIDLGNVPIVPDQYGDDANGRRITTGVIFGETDDDPGKLVRLDFEDGYSRQDLENVLDAIWRQWESESPEAFTGERIPHIKENAIREIFSFRKF